MSKLLPRVGHLQDVDVHRETGRLLSESFGAGGKPVLIMIYGSYCGHCIRHAPDFVQVFNEHKQRKVFMCAVQTDDTDPGTQRLMKYLPEVLNSKGIKFRGVPTYVMVYPNGQWKEVSGRTREELRALVG
jgi:thiol-disulfide isomerase/thioredoxin